METEPPFRPAGGRSNVPQPRMVRNHAGKAPKALWLICITPLIRQKVKSSAG